MVNDVELRTYKLGRERNFLLMMLFALATLAIFDLGNISLSFVFGLALIVLSLRDYRFFLLPWGLTKFLLLFVFISITSLVISEVPEVKTTPIRAVQLVYWFLLAVFVFNAYEFIDKIFLSKVIFIAALLFITLDITIMDISQNAVAFTVVIMGPLGYFFLNRYFYRLCYALLLMLLMLLNGSRTGAVLAFFQTLFFFFLFTPRLNRYARFLLITVFVIAISLNLVPLRISIGKLVNPVNERVGELLINPGEVFRNDMSWLQRRAQVNKGKQIFELHPLLGIGIFNFPRYGIDTDLSNIETDRGTIRNIENRSAHNTYVALLAETGLLGLSSVLIMFAFALWPYIKEINSIGGTFEGCVFVSFIGMLGYFYLISGFFGSSAWLIYGLILGASRAIKLYSLTY